MSRLHVALSRDPHWRDFEQRTPEPASGEPAPLTFTSGTVTNGGDLHEFATEAASNVISRLLGRERAEWRRVLESVRVTLETLGRAADSAGVPQTDLAEEISGMVADLVAAAASEATAAADKARAESDATIEELQSRLMRLEIDSQHKLTLAAARQQEEHALRVRAEEAQAESERIQAETAAAYESRLEDARVRAEIDHQHFAAVREQMLRSLEQAIRVVRRNENGDTETATLTEMSPQAVQTQSGDPIVRDGESSVRRALAVQPPRAETPVTAAGGHEAAPEILEFVQQSLREIEAAYWADIAAKSPIEAVSLLTANLRVSRAQVASRFSQLGEVVPTLFEDQLMAVLNTRSDTSYGRHLSISVRELYPIKASATAASKAA